MKQRNVWLGTMSWLLAVALVTACSEDPGSANKPSSPVCVTSEDCEISNPCAIGTCSPVTGQCEVTPAPNGTAPSDEEGNCRRVLCVNGLGTVEEDPSDRPTPDNPCLTGQCIEGVPYEVPVQNDTPCTLGGGNGTCQDGVCAIPCDPSNADIVCDDSNICTVDSCDTDGFCVNDPSNDPLPEDYQTDGDCQLRTCDDGEETTVDDDDDPPVPLSDCEVGSCSSGVGVTNPAAEGTPCGSNGLCDGQGNCAGCLVATDCPANFSPDCGSVACNNGVCDTTLESAGTVIPNQTVGDCQTQVCDGAGMVTSQNDDSDVPSDPSTCTLGDCSNGTPGTSDATAGTPCGSSNICDGQGLCCTPAVCGPNHCGTMASGCNTQLSCGGCSEGQCGLAVANVCSCADGVQNNGEQGVDCGGPCTTTCGGGTSCNQPSECSSNYCIDNVCCNGPCNGDCEACTQQLNGVANGQCLPVIDNSDPDGNCAAQAAGTCGTTGVCVGGACEMHSGNICASETCVSSTYTGDSTCDGAGTCQPPAPVACGSPYACDGTQCESCSDGVQNGNETDVDCGGGGACADCSLGDTCLVPSDCTVGFCVDGVCCDNACGDTCEHCNGANLGTCSFVPAGQDPDGECNGSHTCDGAGSC